MASSSLEQLYKAGVAAIRAGDKEKGKELLLKVIEQDEMHEGAWLWLSAAVTDQDERIVCLENVLTINPNNENARKGLQSLGVTFPRPKPAAAAPSPPPPPPEPEPQQQAPSWVAGVQDVPQTSSRLEHAPSRIMESGFKSKTRSEERREQWRKDMEFNESVDYDIDEMNRPERNVLDLLDAWFAALIFQSEGPLKDELLYGHFMHSLLNLGAASILQIVAYAIPFIVFALFPARLTAYVNSSVELFVPNVSQAELDEFNDSLYGMFMSEALDVDLTAPTAPDTSGINSAALIALIPTLLIGAVGGTFFIFVGKMVQAWATDLVAHWMGGQGDIIQTLHALTIAFVVTSIFQLLIALPMPFLPFIWTLVLGALVGIYRFGMTAFTVGTAQKQGIFLSMGVIIVSTAVLNSLMGMCGFALSFLLAFAS